MFSCRDSVLQEKYQDVLGGLREFQSTCWAVPVGAVASFNQQEGASDFPFCHTATMTGAVSLLAAHRHFEPPMCKCQGSPLHGLLDTLKSRVATVKWQSASLQVCMP